MSNIVTLNLQVTERFKEFIAYAAFESNPETEHKAIAIDLDVLEQEFDNLFSTHKYEKPHDPEYYNPLDDLVGELWRPSFANFALQSTINKINAYIPRVTIDQNNTSFTYEDHKVDMELVFYYKNDFKRTLYSYKRQFDTVI